MTRVLVVDDHPVVRAGVVALLSAQPGIEVVGAAASGEEAVKELAAADPPVEVLLCDLRLGDGVDGVGITRQLRQHPQPPAVLILTTYDHDSDILRAVEAGAAGYLLKDAAPEEIVDAIERAARGETVLSAAQSERVVATMRVRRAALSARELEVVRLVARGLGNRAIARELVVGEATVKTHLNHVFTKLGVDSRTAAVAAARAAGLIEE